MSSAPGPAQDNLRCAKCDQCPLRDELRAMNNWVPVPGALPEKPSTANIAIVAHHPGKTEEALRRPFTGPMGVWLDQQLRRHKLDRRSLGLTYAVACRYPRDDAKAFHARLKKKNRRRREKGLDPIPTPEECCRPRLDADLASIGGKRIITLGSYPLRVLAPQGGTLRDVRGAPQPLPDGRKLLATRDDMQRNVMWRDVVSDDIGRAIRFFAGRLEWQEPKVRYIPTAAQLRALIAKARRQGRAMVVDVETAPSFVDEEGKRYFDGRTDPLRCVGIGTKNFVQVIPFLSVDGHTRFYPADEEQEIRQVLTEYLADEEMLKVGHNFGYYDVLVLEREFGRVRNFDDTHLIHKLAESEYPHGLGFLGSRYTDAPAWKAEHTATEAETDEELWFYNARDIAVNDVCYPIVKRKAKLAGQLHLLPKYRALQTVCRGMHKLGIKVNEQRRQEHLAIHTDKMVKAQAELDQVIGMRVNPRSTAQLQELFFTKWGLPPQGFTDAGDPSTDDASLRGLLANPLLKDYQRRAIYLVRDYRASSVLISTFLSNWVPGGGFVSLDGFIYPDYNPAGTVGWRFSSSNPNFQNIPWYIRDVFEAGEGYAFVYADYDQLELRLAAALADCGFYIDAFLKKEIDTHNLTGTLVFGDDYWKVEGAPTDPRKKGEGKFQNRRDLIKRFTYAALYGALAPTIHGVITEAEDNTGALMFLDLSVRDIRLIHKRWTSAVPEFPEWWERSVAAYRRQGFIEDPVWGLRRYFANGEDANEIINTAVQFGGAAIVHTGMFRVLREVPFNLRQGTGLVTQTHDALTLRVLEKDAEATKQLLDDKLVVTNPNGINMVFTAEAKVKTTL